MIHQILLTLAWWFMRTLLSTYRVEHAEINKRYRELAGGSFIFAVWHEHGISTLIGHAFTEPYLVLASKSKDGDFAAHVSQKVGMVPVRGSSRKKNVDKGGKEAIEEYVRQLGNGLSGGITVDGPKGPRHVCKIGIAKIAQHSGRPIIPAHAIATRYWTINSWDKFKIPKPFSKITVTYSEPLWVKSDASQEELLQTCKQVEDALKKLET